MFKEFKHIARIVKEGKCIVCGKKSYISTGWHPVNKIDFCSTACLLKYLETSKEKAKV